MTGGGLSYHVGVAAVSSQGRKDIIWRLYELMNTMAFVEQPLALPAYVTK